MKEKFLFYFLILIIFSPKTPSTVFGKTQVIEKIYKVPYKKGFLRLNVPITWKDEIDLSNEAQEIRLKFSPPLPVSSTFYIRVTWRHIGDADFNSPKRVRERVKKDGMKLLPQAVEKDLHLKTIKGNKTKTGYFYRLTDKNPNPGGYKYICQGSIGVADLLLTFTFFTNAKKSDFEKSALAMIISAEKLPDRE